MAPRLAGRGAPRGARGARGGARGSGTVGAGLEGPGVARGGHLRPGLAGANQVPPGAGVLLGEQPPQGDVHEVRVAEVGVAVGEGQVEGLGHGVQVGGAAGAHLPQVEALQEVEGQQQAGALAPGATGVDVQVTVGGVRRGLQADAELRQVVLREQAPLLAVEGGDLAGQLPPVEEVAGGPDAGLAVAPGAPLGFDQAPEGVPQLGLAEDLPHLGHAAVREEGGGGGGVTGEGPAGAGGGGDGGLQLRVQGEPAFGQLQGRLQHLGQGHGAELGQGGEPGVRRRGGHGAGDAGGEVAPVAGEVVLQARGVGPAPQATDGDHVRGGAGRRAGGRAGGLRGGGDDDGGHPTEHGQLGLHHVDADPGGYPGVDGVAAPLRMRRPPMVAR